MSDEEDTRALFYRASRPMTVHHQSHTAVDLLAMDHVALAMADPGAAAAYLCEHVGLHEHERSPEAIVVGAGDSTTKLTLLASEGAREPGALVRIVLRVSDLGRAVAALPPGTPTHDEDGWDTVTFAGPEGLGLGLTFMAGGAVEYDLDHVVLRVADIEEMRVALAELGCLPRGDTLHVADKGLTLEQGAGGAERPLLHHIAVRVASIEALSSQARSRGLQISEPDDGEAFAIVLPGPERLRLDFVA